MQTSFINNNRGIMHLDEALNILKNNNLIVEDEVVIREATYEEYIAAFKKVAANEVEQFYTNATPEQRHILEQQIIASADIIWDRLLHKYTITGEEILATLPNQDGSTYISMAYVPPMNRGNWGSIKAFKKCIEDSPNGVSLHTNRNNKRVINLVKYFGFTEYPSAHQNELFFANKPGIGGNEWVTNDQAPDTD